ncbi:MAG: Maf family protein [Actinobacteria bacterium]|nr:Maf family protein [Actinomycetota bacterium]
MTKPVVLASGSPRRLELLGRLGLDVHVQPTDVDETPRDGEPPAALVRRLAAAKASRAAAGGADPALLVVAADTEVVHDGDVLGKPSDDEDAAAMLRRLSGDWHTVLTGLALRLGTATAEEVVATRVRFRPVTAEEISWYVATGEPRDKAGAYGIQGAGGAFVEAIEGSDSNVVGLPLATVVLLARRLGMELLGPTDRLPRPGGRGPSC